LSEGEHDQEGGNGLSQNDDQQGRHHRPGLAHEYGSGYCLWSSRHLWNSWNERRVLQAVAPCEPPTAGCRSQAGVLGCNRAAAARRAGIVAPLVPAALVVEPLLRRRESRPIRQGGRSETSITTNASFFCFKAVPTILPTRP
jgi:hypothetical protein